MPGRIRADDVALVKERASLEDVVRDHVTLRPGGYGALKGLCPFHDEKSPSFNVRPALGAWHCFGCGEGGDVISFVQKIDHLPFGEAVEWLAGRFGVELHYEEGGSRDGEGLGLGRRGRLVEAHRVAEEYYAHALLDAGMPGARVARDFMRARGFDGAVARRFGVGFAPRGGDDLLRHLRGKGFTDDEVVTAGLVGRGNRGLYDRFRGRLVWPIRDVTGDTIGFGARRIFDDDRIEAKYLNTTETPIYKKSTVLYGLDLAKKAIARERVAVVVEGYTDVMACQLAGVEGAVATCGTAFGPDHIKILRRMMRDEADLAPARVVFTFDGDAAGQKAAERAFKEDQRWASQSFVAVAPEGQDPCELRQNSGDAAVRGLIADAVPLFEFVIRTAIARFDLGTAEGRVAALRAVAPTIAEIRDPALRPEYVRTVAGWLGIDVEQARSQVAFASRRPKPADARSTGARHTGSGSGSDDDPGREVVDGVVDGVGDEPRDDELSGRLPAPDLRNPLVLAERQLLQCLIQFPSLAGERVIPALVRESFLAPVHQEIAEAVAHVLPDSRGLSARAWVDAVSARVPLAVAPVVGELAVAPIPTRMDPTSGMPTARFVDELAVRVRRAGLDRRIADAMSRLRQLETGADAGSVSAEHREVAAELTRLQRLTVALKDEVS